VEKQEPEPDSRSDANSRDSQSLWKNQCSSGEPLMKLQEEKNESKK
jgi:hypothetical protein